MTLGVEISTYSNVPYATLLTQLDLLVRTVVALIQIGQRSQNLFEFSKSQSRTSPNAVAAALSLSCVPNLRIIIVPKLDEDSEDCNYADVAGSLPDQWQQHTSLQAYNSLSLAGQWTLRVPPGLQSVSQC